MGGRSHLASRSTSELAQRFTPSPFSLLTATILRDVCHDELAKSRLVSR